MRDRKYVILIAIRTNKKRKNNEDHEEKKTAGYIHLRGLRFLW